MEYKIDDVIESIKKQDEKIGKTVELISDYGMIDGGHHKQWLLDKCLRTLLGPEQYKIWRTAFDNYTDENGESYQQWDEGTAP